MSEFSLSSRVFPVRSFARNERGAIAILFALLLIPLLLFTGGAIDYSRYNAVRADLIESMDAAGLAMAQMDAMNPPEIANLNASQREAALKEYGRQFFLENFNYENLVDELNVDFEMSSATITPRATGTMDYIILDAAYAMMGISNQTYLDMTTDTEITRRGSGRIELALVLDVTGSMADPPSGSSTSKIQSLRDAVDNLLDVMYGSNTRDPNVRMAVVPFNAHVNPGGAESWDSAWGDLNAQAPYHGARFFHVDASGNVDMSTKVNHYRLHESVTDSTWAGCVEERPYPLDELDVTPGVAPTAANISSSIAALSVAQEPDARMRLAYSRAPALKLPLATVASTNATRWVPLFREDEPNCFSNSANCFGDWTDSETYVDGGATTTVTMDGFKVDDPGEDSSQTMDRTDYANRSFIDDVLYANRNQSGEYEARYWRVLHQIRTAQEQSYASLNNNMDAFKSFLIGLNGAQYGTDEYVGRQAYVGWWNAATNKYVHKYNVSPSIDNTISDTDEVTRGPNQGCPAAILPLTDERADIEAKMDGLFPSGNTNSANGMAWGWRVLSPGAPFTEGVDQSGGQNPQWQKAIVLMTDGLNTIGNRDTHLGSPPSAYGYEIEERMGSGVNVGDDSNASYSAASMRDQLDEKLLRICRRAKQENILVYTIVFGLDDANLEAVFKSCATSPTAPYYHKAPTKAQLEAAFGQIAQDLVNLHVSR